MTAGPTLLVTVCVCGVEVSTIEDTSFGHEDRSIINIINKLKKNEDIWYNHEFFRMTVISK